MHCTQVSAFWFSLRQASRSAIKMSPCRHSLQAQQAFQNSIGHVLMALQVLNVKQTAQVLLHWDMKNNVVFVILEDLLNKIALEEDYLAKDDLMADPHDAITNNEWTQFWQYTDKVNPYVYKHAAHVPFSDAAKKAVSVPLLMY